ncbi:MAG TPA: transglycosylase domain-containing protein [Chloroflexota bacterium]|nr:transglycosylase domain-containing protein [Chloroflexota bacterium]
MDNRDMPVEGSGVRRRAARVVRFLAAGLALVLLLTLALSYLNVIDWEQLGSEAGPPWDSVLNPALAPKALMLMAGEGLLFLSLWGLSRLLALRRIRLLLGEGTVTVFRRLVQFGAWLPVVTAAYLLFRISPDTLRVDLDVHGDVVSLTLPTLAATLAFGLAVMVTPPSPRAAYLPAPLSWAMALPFIPTALGAVLFLDQALGPSPAHGNVPLQLLVTQLSLLGVEILYLLMAAEAFSADWSDFRQANGWVQGGFALGRAWARLALFLAPLFLGLWLALGATLPAASVLRDGNGQFVQYYYPGSDFRLYTPSEAISPWVKTAIDAIEDPGVYTTPFQHMPLKPVRIVGVFTGAARSVQDREGSYLSGASGIAAQSCKNYFGRRIVGMVWDLPDWVPFRQLLAMAATVVHKLAFEFQCGWAYERSTLLLGAERSPVTFYLNAVYFGHGAYGVEAASLTYFGKRAAELTLPEAALLAGLPQAPSVLDPWEHPDEVRARRTEVLQAMEREGYISQSDMLALDRSPLGVLAKPLEPNANAQRLGHYALFLADWLRSHGYGDPATAGLDVTISLDLERQKALDEQVRSAVNGLKGRNVNNGGAVVLDPRNGAVLAWFGGMQPIYGAEALPDMAAAYPHQPGSALKPLLFACALQGGQLAPDERLDDTPREIGGRYIANWDGDPKGKGMLSGAAALADSRNTIAASLVERMGTDGFVQCLRDRFQVRTDLAPEQHGVELGLGLAEMPVLEVAAAFTVLANGGVYAEPTPSLMVRDRHGRELFRLQPAQGSRVLDPATLQWLREPLSDISRRFGLPAGLYTKTGTTPSSSFAVGYGSDLVVAGWLGRTAPGRGPLDIDDVDGREAAERIWKPQALHQARP